MPEDFENGCFTLKTHQMFSVQRNLKTLQRVKLWQLNIMTMVTLSLSLKCFPSILKRKASVFKFLRFEERFRKAPNSLRNSV